MRYVPENPWVAVLLLLAAGGCVTGEEGGEAAQWAVAIFPSGAEYSLELARTDQERALGYMFRQEVTSHEGMLFLFDATGVQPFWMRNCMVSLDIIWLDEKLQVVHIAQDAPPCPAGGECPSIEPSAASRYVLEVAAGQAATHGLRVGDVVVILSEPPLF